MALRLVAHGQVTLTGNEDDIPAAAEVEGVQLLYVGALAANAGVTVFGLTGLTVANGVEVPKGGGHYLETNDPLDIRVRGTVGDKVSWAAWRDL